MVIDTAKKVQQNPFVGLRPFKREESHLYFGRDKQINDVKNKLLNTRFTGIIGDSGLGKSSFVYCGLLNTLMNENPELWQLCVSRPSMNPIGNLLYSITGKEFSKEECNQFGIEKIVEEIKILHAQDGKNYLLFLDQFEEIFRFAQENDFCNTQARLYVEMFLHAFSQKDVPVFVILTMRSEFIGACAQYPNLTEKLNESQFLIPQMTREEKREAIVNPIKLMGATIDEHLVNKILFDAGDSADQLPVMQHALMRTWEQWKRNRFSAEQPISVADYEAVGGMQKALSVHANEVYSQLNETERKICEKIFKTITERGSGGKCIRRATPLAEVTKIADYPIAEVAHVVNHFRKSSNGLLMPPEEKPLTEDSMVDISHESLMRVWGTLSQWVDEEAESVKLYLRLSEAAEMHQLGKTGLWRPPDLQIAQSWRNETKPSLAWGLRHNPTYERAMLFLDFSQKEYDQEQANKEKLQKRRLANARKISIASIVAVIICLLFLLYALQQGEQARKASDAAKIEAEKAKKASKVAEQEKVKADASAKVAEKQSMIALEKEKEALMESKRALEAKKAAEQSALAALIAEKSAQNEKAIAVKQMEIANINKQVADINNKLAGIEKQKALIAQKNVENLQMVSLAKTMAIKSSKVPDSDLQGLIAQQATLLNKQFSGKENDPDIYQGLYYAIKTLKSKKDAHFNQFMGHTSNVRSLVPANDGNVYSTGSDGSILQWAANSVPYHQASSVKPTPIKYTNKINRALAFSFDGSQMACAGEYPFIQIYEGGQLKFELPTNAKEIWFLGFLPSGELISVDNNKKLLSWNTKASQPQPKELLESDVKVNAIATHPLKSQFAIGKNNGEIIIYDNTGNKVNGWKDTNGGVTALAYSANGVKLASGAENGMLRIWESETGKPDEEQKEHRARISALTFSKNGEQLASASFDKTVRIWNASNLNEIPIVLDDHKDWVWSIAFSPDNKKLLAGCKDNMIRVWATHAKDMDNIICGELKALNARNELKMTRNEWEKYVKKLEDEATPECTCCKD